MKKIEITQPIDLPKECKDSVIITRYPFWMKWLMGFVEFYIIPNTYDHRIVYPSLGFYENYDKVEINPLGRIGDVT